MLVYMQEAGSVHEPSAVIESIRLLALRCLAQASVPVLLRSCSAEPTVECVQMKGEYGPQPCHKFCWQILRQLWACLILRLDLVAEPERRAHSADLASWLPGLQLAGWWIAEVGARAGAQDQLACKSPRCIDAAMGMDMAMHVKSQHIPGCVQQFKPQSIPPQSCPPHPMHTWRSCRHSMGAARAQRGIAPGLMLLHVIWRLAPGPPHVGCGCHARHDWRATGCRRCVGLADLKMLH